MPATVNGVGTRYAGRKNVEVRQSECEHCHRVVGLQSYETRLWFCVIFIPIIPFGRKQILDYCPSCTWHRAMNWKEWDRIRSEAIQNSAEQFRDKQDSPEAGLQMLDTLIAFRKRQEATQLARMLKTQHHDHAGVQMHVASWLEQEGLRDEASECFLRAWELEPQTPAIRRAWGMTLAEQGKLQEAADILHPGSPAFDLGTSIFLAVQSQKAGDHQRALDLFRSILKLSPGLSKDKSFRRMVKESEDATGAAQSMIPRIPLRSRAGFWWFAVPATAVSLYLAAAFLIAQRRTVHLVNGAPVSFTVSIDGAAPVSVPASSWIKLPLAEGSHVWRINEPAALAGNGTLNLTTSFWTRPFRWSSAFIFDPSQTAITVVEHATYAERAQDASVTREFHVGRSFLQQDHIDHLFENLPDEIRGKSREDMRRSRLDVIVNEPALSIAYIVNEVPADQRLAFLERHLRLTPGHEGLMDTYSQQGILSGQQQRMFEFLKSDLSHRPILIGWHRAYQGIAGLLGHSDELLHEYDALLASAPNDSALLYLRARIEPDAVQVESLCRKSIAADASNPWPLLALSHRLLSIGEFAEARDVAEKALKLKPDNHDFEQMVYTARLALRDHAALERELKETLAKTPLNMLAHLRLLDVLAAQNKLEEAVQIQNAYVLRVRAELPSDPFDFIPTTDFRIACFQEQFDRALAVCSQCRNETVKRHFQQEAFLPLHRFDELQPLLSNQPGERGMQELKMHIAGLDLDPNNQSDDWYEKALANFALGTAETRMLADVMRMSPGLDQQRSLQRLSLQDEERLNVLLTVAARTPAEFRQPLLELAMKLNFRPGAQFGSRRRLIEALAVK